MQGRLETLISTFPRNGRVEWLGVRSARKAPMILLQHAVVLMAGIEGDRTTRPDRTVSGKRAVTLIQAEHLPAIASLAGLPSIDSAMLRRNILVSGINLLALRDKTIMLGSAVLKITGPCAPCSRMEEILGSGGYNAMRGHGGMTAMVVKPGVIALGDTVTPIDPNDSPTASA